VSFIIILFYIKIENMKRLISKIAITLTLAGFVFTTGCNKEDPYELIVPGEFVHFVGPLNQTYQMTTNPAPVYKMVIGTTDVSSSARTATITVSSNTGAVAGTHYTIVGGNTITIPAGQSTASFDVQGVASQYAGTRTDTLKFSFTQPGVEKATFSDTVKLLLRGACLESDANVAGMAGTYTRTFENGTYGPYVSTITTPVVISPTSGRATLTNIYDSGISALVTFNYATPGSFTATVADQATGFTSGGLPLSIRSTPATTSRFTYCTPTLTLYLDLYTSAGIVDRWVTTMAR
jgi:hypothetical protein